MDGILKAKSTCIELAYNEEDKLTQLWAKQEAEALNSMVTLLTEIGRAANNELIGITQDLLKIAK